MRYRRALAVGASLLCLPPLFWLTGLANREPEENPAVKRQLAKAELYNECGLKKGEELSGEILYEDEEYIWYSDRILCRFRASDSGQRAENLAVWYRNLASAFPEGVRSWVVPVPNRILYEEGYEEEYILCEGFVSNLRRTLGETAEVVDLYQTLREHEEEYIYYRTGDGLTGRGGCYAAGELLGRLGILDVPSPGQFHETVYAEEREMLWDFLKVKYGRGSRAYEILSQMPPEPVCLYEMPRSKNRCEVYTRGETDGELRMERQPLISKNRIGSSAVFGAQFEWAVAAGEGKSGRGAESLLVIGDADGRSLVPFLAQCYDKVYFINLEYNKVFGTDRQPVERIFEEYDIRDVVYIQNASKMGMSTYSAGMRNFWK